MSWYEFKKSNSEWIQIAYNFNIESFKNLNTGYSKSHINIISQKLVYKENDIVKSFTLIKLKKIFNVHIINIDGGIEGKKDHKVFLSLIDFFNKSYKYFVIKINQKELIYDKFFISLGFLKISNDKIYDIYKNLNKINNESSINQSYSQYWRRNLKRTFRYNLQIENNNIYEKEINYLLNDLHNIKKIKNNYNEKSLLNLFENFHKNLFISKAKLNNKICSIRAIIFFKNKAWDILSATNLVGRRCYASYAVTNEVVQFCIKNNIDYYDLSGVDLHKNISVYNFKKGLGGELKEISSEMIFSNFLILKILFKFIFKLRLKFS